MIFPRQYSSLLWYVGLAALAQGALASLQPHRRRLSPSENIIAALDSHLANGIAHPHFTLVANYNDQEENLFVPAAPFEISVALTKSSVTEETSFSIDGGENFAVTSSVQFLISAEEGDAGLPPAFAILTIDRNANTVSGLVQKDGKLVKLEQVEGGETTVTEVNFVPPKDWTCNVVRDDEDGRRLQERHHAHDEHHHQHDISLDPLFDLNMLDPAMIQRRRKAYATDTFPNKWTFQVDLYIEVDDAFVNYHDPSNTANMPNTITYVNALITAISSIYEREVDTHLNVLHISKTSMYNTVGNVAQALQLMESTYGSSTNWHYTDPNGQPPDLHHAILYRSLGGGIAYLGTVCNSRLGFAVSSGVQGSLTDINNGALYWDINVIAHEVGHNFGADHTHEMNLITAETIIALVQSMAPPQYRMVTELSCLTVMLVVGEEVSCLIIISSSKVQFDLWYGTLIVSIILCTFEQWRMLLLPSEGTGMKVSEVTPTAGLITHHCLIMSHDASQRSCMSTFLPEVHASIPTFPSKSKHVPPTQTAKMVIHARLTPVVLGNAQM
eukprot:CCRYP_000585-RC/>CCRYP_000585-RC protein AED:0.21 eAED:0.21 QI:277/0.75/0.8/1/0.75/0.8/5/0/555